MIDLGNLDWATSEQAAAIRELQKTKDRFGLALRMIAEGCAAPQSLAKQTLDNFTTAPR